LFLTWWERFRGGNLVLEASLRPVVRKKGLQLAQDVVPVCALPEELNTSKTTVKIIQPTVGSGRGFTSHRGFGDPNQRSAALHASGFPAFEAIVLEHEFHLLGNR
jgi:hypothetical protein